MVLKDNNMQYMDGYDAIICHKFLLNFFKGIRIRRSHMATERLPNKFPCEAYYCSIVC